MQVKISPSEEDMKEKLVSETSQPETQQTQWFNLNSKLSHPLPINVNNNETKMILSLLSLSLDIYI